MTHCEIQIITVWYVNDIRDVIEHAIFIDNVIYIVENSLIKLVFITPREEHAQYIVFIHGLIPLSSTRLFLSA